MKHTAAALETEPLIVQFSGGKDSIVMLDLLTRHHHGSMTVVFLYFVPGLAIKERILIYYENRYGITIHREPSHRALTLKTGKRWKMADVEHMLREKYDVSYIAQGARKQDSMARRGQLANLPDGVDHRNFKFYPVSELSDREVYAYIKQNKLKLPVEYDAGMTRDFWVPDAAKLMWLKHTFPRDYERVIAEFPQMEAMAQHEVMYGRR